MSGPRHALEPTQPKPQATRRTAPAEASTGDPPWAYRGPKGFFRLAGRPRVTGLWSQAGAVARFEIEDARERESAA
ncbi:hypothetical protein [Streptomyces sp. Qhu_M48]|uniref:hypothetical protein n=1 Tax=Streptomyces sp. Qhu_M48 TaxID=3435889 RepID=UPI003F50B303